MPVVNSVVRCFFSSAKVHQVGNMQTRLTMMLTVTAASAYMLPFAPAQHHCPARMPVIRAFAEVEAGVSTAPVTAKECQPIQPLTTVFEQERAVADAQAAGRLCVVKVYAPRCKVCLAIGPKYLRMAEAAKAVAFYEVDFSSCPSLGTHMGVESLPTVMIFKDGAKVEQSTLRPSDFKSFVKTLMAFAEPESSGSSALESYKSNMDELRVAGLRLSERGDVTR